jgi:assimilatory nitrate reductase catalytic subunit
LPGYRSFESEEHRNELAGIWNIDAGRIPTKRGLAYPDIIEAAIAGKIRPLWIIGTNPLVSFPNLDVLKQAFENLQISGCTGWLPSYAHHGIGGSRAPGGHLGRKGGTYTNSERRVSKVDAAVKPPGEARAISTFSLPSRSNLVVEPSCSPTGRNRLMRSKSGAAFLRDGSATIQKRPTEMIERCGGIQWPFGSGAQGDAWATRRLYSTGEFPTGDGRARLIPTRWAPFPEQPSADFPFVLNTGRTVKHWHTRTKTGSISILQEMSPRAWLEMNPVDARRLSLKPHDRVEIISARGRVSKVELRVTEIIAPGQVFLLFHFAESNANQVTQSAFDPISRKPNFEKCAVRVEKSSIAST